MESWIFLSGLVEKGVLVLLLGLSVWSISIMIDRYKVYKSEEKTDLFLKLRDLIGAGKTSQVSSEIDGEESVLAGTLKAAMEVSNPTASKIESATSSYLLVERERLEKGLTTLATLGANAPFIGLFGTVLGIIKAFAALSGGQAAGGSSIMSGIAIALIATAAGLFVAIPAVIAFNVASRRLQVIIQSCESLKDLYLSRLESIQMNSSGGTHGS